MDTIHADIHNVSTDITFADHQAVQVDGQGNAHGGKSEVLGLRTGRDICYFYIHLKKSQGRKLFDHRHPPQSLITKVIAKSIPPSAPAVCGVGR